MNRNFEMVAEVLQWLVTRQHDRPSLAALSNRFGVSEHHLQRTFRKYAGISPKQFQKFLDKEHAIMQLKSGSTVLETSLNLELSGPGRLHDLLVSTEAVTPGEARLGGLGVTMSYGLGQTPFGSSLIAWTTRGISFLGFARASHVSAAVKQMRAQWPAADWLECPGDAQEILNRIFGRERNADISVCLRGSPFQLKVWEALLRIPAGTNVSYGQLASAIGKPGASRAVGAAIGRNPVAWLVPCHRVITSLGTPGGYRWGLDTKIMMNAWESGQISGAA